MLEECDERGARSAVSGLRRRWRLCCGTRPSVRVPGVRAVALLALRGACWRRMWSADRDQPPFDRSTRDGFAVRAAEWSGGKRLRVAGQVRAGEVWARRRAGGRGRRSRS